MAVYQIGGGQYELPDNISGDQLQAVVGQISGNGQTPSPASSAPAGASSAPSDPADSATFGGELGKAVRQDALDAAHPIVAASGALDEAIANGLGATGM